MIRVSSLATVIITSGVEKKRMPNLTEFSQEAAPNSSIEVYELELSTSAQLINILRTELKDKPLSHALKDRNILKKAM
jgi:hypothetical protein